MELQNIWICTSKNSKLFRIYRLNTGDEERKGIWGCFHNDLNWKLKGESEMQELNGNALIEDIPYYIDFDSINEDNYLNSFREKISEVIENHPTDIIQFSNNIFKPQDITNFEEKEGIKFIIAQSEKSLYFLLVPTNAVLKNRSVMSFSITEHTAIYSVPRGIQVPSILTAKLDVENHRLFVYDVNRFESMLTLNENQKAKSRAVLKKFNEGQFKISTEKYTFSGLEDNNLYKELSLSKRAIRRLSKYHPSEETYSIEKIKKAVNKLDESLKVKFDDEKRIIHVTPETAKTFVGIIHNSIVQRLISGEVEITI